MDILDSNVFDMYDAHLTKLFSNDSYGFVPVHDALLTSVIEVSPGNKMDKKIGI